VIFFNPRDILNELKWRDCYDLKYAEIWIVHRGAKNNTKIIYGSNIVNLGKSFIETTDSMIPYHRIFKIIYNDNVIFQRSIR
jgi:uncharacterized protein (UPF0248 family)